MRLVKFAADGQERMGLLAGDSVVDISAVATDVPSLLSEGASEKIQEVGARGPRYGLDQIRFVPPLLEGSTIFCVGVNYLKKHPVGGEATQRPVHPTIFVKRVESLVGHREQITYPAGISDQLDYEGELVIVMGREARHVPASDALSYVAGYTIMNEGSVRDWQKHSLFSGKNFLASGSCGPYIVTADEVGDPMELTLTTRVNGEERQRTGTGAMLFDVPQIISHISTFTRLSPGDMIATGSPSGSGGSLEPPRFLRPGDRVEIEISRIGTLANEVA